jgi:hypothetical protein
MLSTVPSPVRPTTAKASRLASVKKGVLHEPHRYFLYGPEGVGKSSLAVDAPAPVFFDTDRGSRHLDVPRYTFRDEPDGYIAVSFAEVLDGIDDLLTNEHPYRTLVVDTLDALEALIWSHVCERVGAGKNGRKPRTVEEIPYGNGYKVAVDEFRVLCHRLDQLRLRRGMEIVFIGHSTIKKFDNPLGEDFDRYRPRLHDLALAFVKEWVDVLGFVAFEDGAAKLRADDDRGRARGFSTGRRVLRFERSAAWDAKTRLPMAAEVELAMVQPWAPIAAAVDASRRLTPDNLRSLIAVRLAQLGEAFTKASGEPATAEAVRAVVERSGDDVAALARVHAALQDARRVEVTA